MTYLLDTNAWVAFLRNKHPNLVQRVSSTSPADINLCSIVLGELLFGAHHSPPAFQASNLALVNRLRQQFVSLEFNDRAAEEYAVVREDLTQRGLLIGANDMLIAAIALANDLTLVTNNTAEFSRVRGLRIEDWQTP